MRPQPKAYRWHSTNHSKSIPTATYSSASCNPKPNVSKYGIGLARYQHQQPYQLQASLPRVYIPFSDHILEWGSLDDQPVRLLVQDSNSRCWSWFVVYVLATKGGGEQGMHDSSIYPVSELLRLA